MGNPEHLIQLLKQLRVNKTTNVKVNVYCDNFDLKIGVRQGYIISHKLLYIANTLSALSSKNCKKDHQAEDRISLNLVMLTKP